jgi:hypothetical protein
VIKGGVRCVIAAGWAVEDEAASIFATTFYRTLLRGERFIDAVAAAREKARECGGNTWAAYQCYGDPDWRFRMPSWREFASIASASSLIFALEQIAMESEYQRQKPERPACATWERLSPATGNAATSRKRLQTHARNPDDSRMQLPGTSARGPRRTGRRLSLALNNWSTPGSVLRGSAWRTTKIARLRRLPGRKTRSNRR